MSVVVCDKCQLPLCDRCDEDFIYTCECGSTVCDGCVVEDDDGNEYCSEDCMKGV